jgi:hypothetical protein
MDPLANTEPAPPLGKFQWDKSCGTCRDIYGCVSDDNIHIPYFAGETKFACYTLGAKTDFQQFLGHLYEAKRGDAGFSTKASCMADQGYCFMDSGSTVVDAAGTMLTDVATFETITLMTAALRPEGTSVCSAIEYTFGVPDGNTMVLSCDLQTYD